MNIGIDTRFLHGRLGFTADWYSKKTKDLLINVQANAVSGFSTQWVNGGTVENKGVELALNWNDKVGKDFTYGLNWNMAINKNEVTEIKGDADFIEGGKDLLAQNTGNMARMWKGHAIGCFYGYKTEKLP